MSIIKLGKESQAGMSFQVHISELRSLPYPQVCLHQSVMSLKFSRCVCCDMGYLLNSNSHEIKRHLFLGRKAITNLYSILKSRDIILPAAAAAKSLQSCPTLCDPIDGSPPGSLMPGFSRQEHWSGLPFPSPMHKSEKWKWSCPDPTLSDPMDCSLPGSSVHWIFQARVLQRSV